MKKDVNSGKKIQTQGKKDVNPGKKMYLPMKKDVNPGKKMYLPSSKHIHFLCSACTQVAHSPSDQQPVDFHF